MKKIKKYKIEKVNHSPFCSLDMFFLTTYYPCSNTLIQTNFATESYALSCKGSAQTGMWRVKPTDK